jgi:hypothetical protein
MTTIVRLTSPALVGRDGPLHASVAALRSVRPDRPGIAIVRGPAGIGKTRFITALVEHLRDDGAAILTGPCLDLEPSVPYSPLIEAFRGVDPAPARLLDALTAGLDLPRSQLFALLREEIVGLARRRLTVLMVEDVQWSDRVTRDALLYLAATARQGRWALVVTVRDEELAVRPAIEHWVALLHRDALVRVSLEALPAHHVAALIEGITGAAPSPRHAHRIHRRSGGVPLLVEEVLAAEAAGTTAVPITCAICSSRASATSTTRPVRRWRSWPWLAGGAATGSSPKCCAATLARRTPRSCAQRPHRSWLGTQARTGCVMSSCERRCTAQCL